MRCLQTFVLVLAVLSLTGWIYECLGRISGLPLSGDYSALFHPTSNFGDAGDFTDLTQYTGQLAGGDRTELASALTHINYPPFALFLLSFFLRCFRHPVYGYVGTTLLVAGTVTAVVLAKVRRSAAAPQLRRWLQGAVLAVALLGSPLWFCLGRGNLEWISCLFAAGSVVLWMRDRPGAASVLLAASISCKPYPALFLLLFLGRRQWRPALQTIVLWLGINTLSLRALGPAMHHALCNVASGWRAYAVEFVFAIRNEQEFRFNHSLFDIVKIPIWFVLFHRRTHNISLTAGSGVPLWARLDLWAALFAVLAAATVAFVILRFRARSPADQVFALTLLILLLPFVSAEYTLLLLYLPMGLLAVRLLHPHSDATDRLAACMLLPCALLLAPLNFLGPFTGFAKTAVLVYLFVRLANGSLSLAPAPAARAGQQERRRANQPQDEYAYSS